MGDDTPSAVLSKIYRPLSHFFRQNFSQVTNPAIDSLREFRVMSLKTRFGNLKNVLDEESSQTEILVLDSPFVAMANSPKWCANSATGCRSSIAPSRRRRADALRAGWNASGPKPRTPCARARATWC